MNKESKIFDDKVNKNNVMLVKKDYEDFCKPKNEEYFNSEIHLNSDTKIIYDKIIALLYTTK